MTRLKKKFGSRLHSQKYQKLYYESDFFKCYNKLQYLKTIFTCWWFIVCPIYNLIKMCLCLPKIWVKNVNENFPLFLDAWERTRNSFSFQRRKFLSRHTKIKVWGAKILCMKKEVEVNITFLCFYRGKNVPGNATIRVI